MSSIIFDNVSKAYHKGTGASTSLIEAIYRGSWGLINRLNGQNNTTSDQLFWALKDVSFEVKTGEAFAIVGPNGAGKSTVLKLLSRVSCPSRGNIITKGKLACLIELGAGFHPELTGRENIFLYGTIMGMTQSEIKKNFDEIIDFSGVSDFLDTPLKRYSSGMHARLGFSVAIHTRPDILLVDEVLAVGDWAFQQKCYAEMEKYRKKGTTIVLVSHNMDAIRTMCNKGVLLDRGKVKVSGTVKDIINGYYGAVEDSKVKKDKKYYQSKARLSEFQLINEEGLSCNSFKPGERAVFSYIVTFLEDLDKVEFGFWVVREDLLTVVSTGSADLGVQQKNVKKGEVMKVEFSFVVNLLSGSYITGCEIRSSRFEHYHDMKFNAINFQVSEHYSHGGIADLRPTCRLLSI